MPKQRGEGPLADFYRFTAYRVRVRVVHRLKTAYSESGPLSRVPLVHIPTAGWVHPEHFEHPRIHHLNTVQFPSSSQPKEVPQTSSKGYATLPQCSGHKHQCRSEYVFVVAGRGAASGGLGHKETAGQSTLLGYRYFTNLGYPQATKTATNKPAGHGIFSEALWPLWPKLARTGPQRISDT